LASGGEDNVVRIWDADTGEEIASWTGHRSFIWSVTFSPDGQRLASAGNDGTLRVWDVKSRVETLVLKGHTGAALCVCFDPSGQQIVSGGYDDTVRFWDVHQGRQIRSVAANDLIVYGVAVGPDSNRLLSSGDEVVKLWDLSSTKVLKTFAGNGGSVLGLALSRDGNRVAAGFSGIQDQHGLRPGEVRVWAIETGELVFTEVGSDPRNSTMRSVCFDPSGQVLASGCSDGVVRVYRA
jgi:WD40 repeat protein